MLPKGEELASVRRAQGGLYKTALYLAIIAKDYKETE